MSGAQTTGRPPVLFTPGFSPPQKSGVRTRQGDCGWGLPPAVIGRSSAPHTMAAVRVVVTGGAGFIGSHVVDALLARGDEVHVLDNLASGRRENVDDAATFHEADIRGDSDRVFDEVQPEA